MKHLKCIISLTILAVPLTSFGWTRTYGGFGHSWANYIIQTSDGGYIATAVTPWDLVRINKYGDTLWVKSYEIGNVYCVEDLDGEGYVLTGSSRGDLCIVKVDTAGNEIWRKKYGGNDGEGGIFIQQTQDEGFIISGCTESFAPSGIDLWILKTDSLGDTLWSKVYGYGEHDSKGICVRETVMGDFIILAQCGDLSGPPPSITWLLKIDEYGDTLWTRSYEVKGYCVETAQDGGYVIVGVSGIYVWMSKTNSEGGSLWTKYLNTGGEAEGRWVCKTEDGNYVVAWHIGSYRPNLWLLKINDFGDTLWTKTYGLGHAKCVHQTKDKGFILAGGRPVLPLSQEILFVRINYDGDTLWFDVSPGIIEKPISDSTIAYMVPTAWFKNSGTMPAEDFYCHCEIWPEGSGLLSPPYHVKYWISYPLDPGDSVLVQFSEWTCDDHAQYTARFYTSKDSEPIWQTREKTVTFYGEPYAGISEDQPEPLQPTWNLATTCGPRLIVQYSGFSHGFSAQIFDAVGRKITVLRSVNTSGSITWGDDQGSGVYFIRINGPQVSSIKRLVLIR